MPTIYGKNGGDTLKGGNSNDNIYGGNGNDSITGGDGNDYLSGSDGNDTLDGGMGNDTIYGGSGNDYYIGGDGNDYLSDTGGNNFFNAGNGNDTVYGDSGSDTIIGSSGNDSIIGWSGDDSLSGGDGNDYLSGGDGNDTLNGGFGKDTLYGGLGNDTYYIFDSNYDIYDSGGEDIAYISTSFFRVPTSIEKIIYKDEALAFPYWINALLSSSINSVDLEEMLGSSKTFNFSFPETLPKYNTSKDDANGFLKFTTIQKDNTKLALTHIASIVDLKFIETTNSDLPNTISFATNNQTDSGGYAYYPSTNQTGSDVFLDDYWANKTLAEGTYGAYTLIHELGHALGLKHPFPSANATGGFGEGPFLYGQEDSAGFTMLSYTTKVENHIAQFSPLDIAALQYLYGPSKTSRTGNDTYKMSSTEANFIWDGSGVDTIDATTLPASATVYLTPGNWGYVGDSKMPFIISRGQITVNFGTTIENVFGSTYNDNLYGNNIGNYIVGNEGNDNLYGLEGNDTINGGSGNDSIDGGVGIDIVEYNSKKSSNNISLDKSNITIKNLANNNDIDSLKNIERLKFIDTSIAFDLDSNAGVAAKVMGAVLGKASIKNSIDFGYWLAQTDIGLSYADIGQKALDKIGLKTNDQIVSTLWKNVIGFKASDVDKAPFIKMLVDGMKPGDLVVLAADTTFNTANINLVGLAQTGIEYAPI
jgi:serralysin